MASDFAFAFASFGRIPKTSVWVHPDGLEGDLLHGDPASERFAVSIPPQPYGQVCEIYELQTTFTDLLDDLSLSNDVKRGDSVYLLLFGHGHGERLGWFEAGLNRFGDPYFLEPANLKKSAKRFQTKGVHLTLFMTSCYSGSWKSANWRLWAAAADQSASGSFEPSRSLRCQGGVFTCSVIEVLAKEFGIQTPTVGVFLDAPPSHDFLPETGGTLTNASPDISRSASTDAKDVASDSNVFLSPLEEAQLGVLCEQLLNHEAVGSPSFHSVMHRAMAYLVRELPTADERPLYTALSRRRLLREKAWSIAGALGIDQGERRELLSARTNYEGCDDFIRGGLRHRDLLKSLEDFDPYDKNGRLRLWLAAPSWLLQRWIRSGRPTFTEADLERAICAWGESQNGFEPHHLRGP